MRLFGKVIHRVMHKLSTICTIKQGYPQLFGVMHRLSTGLCTGAQNIVQKGVFLMKEIRVIVCTDGNETPIEMLYSKQEDKSVEAALYLDGVATLRGKVSHIASAQQLEFKMRLDFLVNKLMFGE
jgi:hypothetical protein